MKNKKSSFVPFRININEVERIVFEIVEEHIGTSEDMLHALVYISISIAKTLEINESDFLKFISIGWKGYEKIIKNRESNEKSRIT